MQERRCGVRKPALKDCPFCGQKPVLRYLKHLNPPVWQVICQNGVHAYSRDAKADNAVRIWNTRTITEAIELFGAVTKKIREMDAYSFRIRDQGGNCDDADAIQVYSVGLRKVIADWMKEGKGLESGAKGRKGGAA
jgi:hypothetical protein